MKVSISSGGASMDGGTGMESGKDTFFCWVTSGASVQVMSKKTSTVESLFSLSHVQSITNCLPNVVTFMVAPYRLPTVGR